MMKRVAIIGAGVTPPRPKTPEVSYKEMTYGVAKQAYREAGITPQEVQTFVTCAEDLNEGVSIFDEYTPDQLGAVQKPMHTITHDGIVGLGNAFMQIQSGIADLVVVEAHSKASNIQTKNDILSYALDPVWTRPLKLNPHFIAGMEMNTFLNQTGNTEESCAAVAVKNRGCVGKKITLQRVMSSKPTFSPLKELETSDHADGAVVLVVASEERARKSSAKPVWIKGISWVSSTSTLESRDWARAVYAEQAAKRVFKMAGVGSAKEIDLFELDDTYAFKELQHMEAIGLFDPGRAGREVLKALEKQGDNWRVNLSGGFLGRGDLLEAKGLYQVAELISRIRGGKLSGRSSENVRTGFALSWRGVPTTSGAAVLLSQN
ncbi:MAG: acetyl-CoA acetyltransferase [Elusimicrobia bacterium]|nr:acetyl-CoA acetyltransferase [Elusimicrobiota bacterium]